MAVESGKSPVRTWANIITWDVKSEFDPFHTLAQQHTAMHCDNLKRKKQKQKNLPYFPSLFQPTVFHIVFHYYFFNFPWTSTGIHTTVLALVSPNLRETAGCMCSSQDKEEQKNLIVMYHHYAGFQSPEEPVSFWYLKGLWPWHCEPHNVATL